MPNAPVEKTKRFLERNDSGRLMADEWQLQIVCRVKGRRLKPRQVGRVKAGVVRCFHYCAIIYQFLHAVVGERFLAGVELVDEEFGTSVQPRKIADAEYTDLADPLAMTRPLGPRPLRLVRDRQPDARSSSKRFRLRVAYTHIHNIQH